MSRLHRRSVLTGSPFSSRVSQWTQRGIVKSTQRVVIAVTAAVSNTATITTVVPANTLIYWNGNTNSGGAGVNSQFIYAMVSLSDATTVRVDLQSSPGANTVSVPIEIVEYFPGVLKSVQRGTLAIGAGTQTITVVDLTKTTLNMLGFITTNANANASPTVRLVLTNATTITITTADSQGQTAGWQVAEFY